MSNTADTADGAFQDWTSAGASGDGVGGALFATGATGMDIQLRWKPAIVARFRTAANVSDIRLWCGFSSAAIGATNTPTSLSTVLLRYSTSASDSNFVAYTSDGVNGTASSAFALGPTLAASTAYTLVIFARSATSIEFWLGSNSSDLVLVHTATATLPAASTSLFSVYITLTALAAAAKVLSFGHLEGSCE